MADIKHSETLQESFNENMALNRYLFSIWIMANTQLGLRTFFFNSTWKYVLETYYVPDSKLITGDIMMVSIHKKSTTHWYLMGGREWLWSHYAAVVFQVWSPAEAASPGSLWELQKAFLSQRPWRQAQQSVFIIPPDDSDVYSSLRNVFIYKGKVKGGI